MSKQDSFHRIFISGASSGIGEALSHAYAKVYREKCILGLLGRDRVRITKIKQQLEEAYQCQVAVYIADVRDAKNLISIADDFIHHFGCPHIVIANAGVSHGTLTEYHEDISVFQSIFDINVMGMINTFQPFIAAQKIQAQNKQITSLVGIASVAGIRGLPGSGAYSASKSAVITYLESLRIELQQYGIRVCTIAPGYIRTPMTDINTYPMPFIMDADVFARNALKVIHKQKRFSIIPWQMGVIARMMRFIPPIAWDFIMKNAPHKTRR